MPQPELTGGCQCGAVRFRAGRLGRSAICHCRMCQKAFGSFFGPLVTAYEVEWTRGAPKYFRSSNKWRRGFCGACGTPLGGVDDDGGIELAVGAFDDPMLAAPVVQFNRRDRLPLFDTLAALPPQPDADKELAHNATIVSHQHPDHDTDTWPPREGFAA
ncbi:MAG: aldehyde-activating protein [Devosia sp. 67-54]|uniref:GFA family protein n=1 Tax=unclassified Devosia TaxID=196773 RepID=UPI0009614527|nr:MULTISPECIES: GFA family protein [unclassified Devosia]MBN9307585.1 GFA family protein [Devosia sp.]OJX19989.1 MAG: aldehyde-activating protein [Devosia sp. 67-54]